MLEGGENEEQAIVEEEPRVSQLNENAIDIDLEDQDKSDGEADHEQLRKRLQVEVNMTQAERLVK